MSGGWAFCFLGSASRLLSHRWGTVKLDDCNLPGRIVNAIIFALLSSRATALAALIHSSGFSVAMRVGSCKPRPHKRPRSKSSGSPENREILKKNREAIEHERAITERD